MNDAREKKTARRGKRSPGYPMISLEEAVQRVKVLWDKDKNNSIPVLAAYEHLGYKTIGGYGGRVLSALKQFGLIYEKQGDIILTNEAVDLALHEQHDDIYVKTIKKLALNPNIYEKLYNEYSDSLPSDATLKVKLIKEYEFNPDKVDGFLSDFRKTIEYANLAGGAESPLKKDIKEEKHPDVAWQMFMGSQNIKKEDTKIQKEEGSMQETLGAQFFPIPLSKMKKAVISFQTLPIEKGDIIKIKKWLDLFSYSLTGEDEPDDKDETSKQ